MHNKNKKFIFQRVLMLMVLSSPLSLLASNVGFLKYAVIAGFSKADNQQLQLEYKAVLDNKRPGDVHSWQNSESKNGGEITVIKQYKLNDQLCKRLKFKNRTKQQSAVSYFNFCLIKQQWALVN